MKNVLIALAVFFGIMLLAYPFALQKEKLFEGSPINILSEISEFLNSSGQKIIKHNGVYIYFVSYENSGFNPRDFKVPIGNSARFVNNSDKAMRVYAKDQSTPYHALNQEFSKKRGEFYTFNFTSKGVWEFYNLNNPNDNGSITVY